MTLRIIAILSVLLFFHIGSVACFSALSLTEKTITWRHVDLSKGLWTNEVGYPKLDRSKVDLSRLSTSEFKAVTLENDYVRVTLLPEMGRVISLFDRIARREVLWTNQIARPLFGQQNELEWWMVWGGVEYTIPSGEHGSTWALPWRALISENSVARKAIRMTVLEPKTKLEQTVEISLERDYAGFEAAISVHNTSQRTVRFSHWVNPMWAPGGRGEITPRTEFIVPTREVKVLPRDFNDWMLGEKLQPWAENPLRFITNWRSIGDLLAGELTNGFYAAFSHESGQGVARIFDHKANPGMDIWTWGFRPSRERQADFSPTPNAGYVEMWGGTVHDFSEASLKPLAPGESMRLTEWMAPFRGTKGLTSASRDVAVNFYFADQSRSQIEIRICALRELRDAAVEVREDDGTKLLAEKLDLLPAVVFRRTLERTGTDRKPVNLVILWNSKEILLTQAVSIPAVQFGGPFLPKAN